MNIKEDNEDYFDRPYEPEEKKPKEPPKPTYTPDDPKYWEEPEPNWEHLKPTPNKRIWLILAAAGIAAGLLWALYLRFFTPYIDEAVQYGYVDIIQKRGSIFKTYEGVLIPYKEIHDTTRVYKEDFVFSVADDHTASVLKRMEFARRPVRIGYKVYRMAFPWKGESRIVVTSADPVDPNRILPPEYQPDRGDMQADNGDKEPEKKGEGK